MRALLSIVSLLAGLWLVLSLVQRQVDGALPGPAAPGQAPAPRHVQQQYQDALDGVLKQNQRKLDAVGELER